MTHHAATERRRFRLLGYVSEIINELKKVVWLTRREITYLTILVLIVSVASGIFLGALDFGFTALIDRILGG